MLPKILLLAFIFTIIGCTAPTPVPDFWPKDIPAIAGSSMMDSNQGPPKEIRFITRETPTKATDFYRGLKGWTAVSESSSTQDTHRLTMTRGVERLDVLVFISNYADIEGTLVTLDYYPAG
jgi:hypothetical protein